MKGILLSVYHHCTQQHTIRTDVRTHTNTPHTISFTVSTCEMSLITNERNEKHTHQEAIFGAAALLLNT
jgi:hypothetical protein